MRGVTRHMRYKLFSCNESRCRNEMMGLVNFKQKIKKTNKQNHQLRLNREFHFCFKLLTTNCTYTSLKNVG